MCGDRGLLSLLHGWRPHGRRLEVAVCPPWWERWPGWTPGARLARGTGTGTAAHGALALTGTVVERIRSARPRAHGQAPRPRPRPARGPRLRVRPGGPARLLTSTVRVTPARRCRLQADGPGHRRRGCRAGSLVGADRSSRTTGGPGWARPHRPAPAPLPIDGSVSTRDLDPSSDRRRESVDRVSSRRPCRSPALSPRRWS